jgi:flagellin-like hook-associated protein FlgL
MKLSDKYILKPISESLSQLGIQEKVLNYHNDWLQSQRNLDEESLSRIQDADMAKELLEKTRADMLQQTSLSLFTQTLDFNKNNILALLN